jgi:hypothetical protein
MAEMYIDLTEDSSCNNSEDSSDKVEMSVPRATSSSLPSMSSRSAGHNKRKRGAFADDGAARGGAGSVRQEEEVIELLSSSDEGGDDKAEDEQVDNDDDNDDDDDDDDGIEIVDPPPPQDTTAKSALCKDMEDDEEFAVVGSSNVMRLPHFRQYCTECPTFTADITLSGPPAKWTKVLKTSEKFVVNNSTICDMCYCYVCDAPAKECTQWSFSQLYSASYTSTSIDWTNLCLRDMPHCFAAEKTKKMGKHWKDTRQSQKFRITRQATSPPSMAMAHKGIPKVFLNQKKSASAFSSLSSPAKKYIAWRAAHEAKLAAVTSVPAEKPKPSAQEAVSSMARPSQAKKKPTAAFTRKKNIELWDSISHLFGIEKKDLKPTKQDLKSAKAAGTTNTRRIVKAERPPASDKASTKSIDADQAKQVSCSVSTKNGSSILASKAAGMESLRTTHAAARNAVPKRIHAKRADVPAASLLAASSGAEALRTRTTTAAAARNVVLKRMHAKRADVPAASLLVASSGAEALRTTTAAARSAVLKRIHAKRADVPAKSLLAAFSGVRPARDVSAKQSTSNTAISANEISSSSSVVESSTSKNGTTPRTRTTTPTLLNPGASTSASPTPTIPTRRSSRCVIRPNRYKS